MNSHVTLTFDVLTLLRVLYNGFNNDKSYIHTLYPDQTKYGFHSILRDLALWAKKLGISSNPMFGLFLDGT